MCLYPYNTIIKGSPGAGRHLGFIYNGGRQKMKGCDTNEQKKKGDLHGINTEQDYEKDNKCAHSQRRETYEKRRIVKTRLSKLVAIRDQQPLFFCYIINLPKSS